MTEHEMSRKKLRDKPRGIFGQKQNLVIYILQNKSQWRFLILQKLRWDKET